MCLIVANPDDHKRVLTIYLGQYVLTGRFNTLFLSIQHDYAKFCPNHDIRRVLKGQHVLCNLSIMLLSQCNGMEPGHFNGCIVSNVRSKL